MFRSISACCEDTAAPPLPPNGGSGGWGGEGINATPQREPRHRDSQRKGAKKRRGRQGIWDGDHPPRPLRPLR